jgi:PAS domain-containing protein
MHKITTNELKRAEKVLRDSKTKLKQAQHLAQVGYWERDLLTDRITLSEEACKIFKLELPNGVVSRAELEEKIFHPDDRQPLTRH